MNSRIMSFFWKLRFRNYEDFPVPLRSNVRKGSALAIVHAYDLWLREPLRRRLLSLITGKWRPSDDTLIDEARRVFLHTRFGLDDDFGQIIMELAIAHYDLPEIEPELSESDETKATSMDVFSGRVTEKLHLVGTNPPLNLGIPSISLFYAFLVVPMSVKVPVNAIRWFIDIDLRYTYYSIRNSGIDHSDSIANYIYEICNVQIKTVDAILRLFEVTQNIRDHKGDMVYVDIETQSIQLSDLIIGYLKALTDKCLVLWGLILGDANIDGQRTQEAKLRRIERSVTDEMKGTPYYNMLRDVLSKDSLSELNSIRTGILHKQGYAKLQPHNYVGVSPENQPVMDLLSYITDQHRSNCIAVLCMLAMLTDKLVELDPPEIQPNFTYYNTLIQLIYGDMIQDSHDTQ